MDFFDMLKSSKRKHSYLGCMTRNQVVDEEGYNLASIIPNNHYFQLRISETFLRLERKYWKEYSPLTVIMLRFLHDGQKHEIPFIISSQTLLNGFSGDTQGWTEFNNIKLGPFPYEEGDVELAIALYAVESRDYARELFSLADNLLNRLQVPLASQAFKTADVIRSVIEQLAALDRVERKLAFYQAFQEDDASPDRFRDQYLLQINGDEEQIRKEKLRIRKGRLYVENQNGELQRASAWDYCLTRIRASDKPDISLLPFSETWKTVRRFVNEDNARMAQNVCSELYRQITLCPDLTENDRKNLPFVFKAKFEEEKERFNLLHNVSLSSQTGAVKCRGAGSYTAAGAAGLKFSAMKLSNTTYSSQIHQSLKKLSDTWDKFPGFSAAATENKDDDLSGELFGQQLDHVRTLIQTENITPKEIADALTLF